MRIAVSSSPFRRLFASGSLTQLEWVEGCASRLGADGIVAHVDDFPRTDAEYVAQLKKVAVDLALVPLGVEAPALLDPDDETQRTGTPPLAASLGALLIRTQAPPPGDVPPATFVAAVAAAKLAAKAAKAVNVTIVVAAAEGTIAPGLDGVRHLLKDVDSAWLRPAPRAALLSAPLGARERVPAFVAEPVDDPQRVAEAAAGSWVILEGAGGEAPWEQLERAVRALREAERTRPRRPSST